MVATRKRRVIKDDEDESNSHGDDDPKMNTEAEEKGHSTAATSMVDRLKRRAAKSAEQAQAKNKRKKEAEDNDNTLSSLDKTVKKEQSIPKKQKINQSIPKKSNDDKNGIMNEEDKVKKDTPSLLSGMKKPLMPKANASKGANGSGSRGIQNSAKNKTKSFQSSDPPSKSSSALSSTPPPANPNPTVMPGQQADTIVPGTTVKEGDNDKFGSGLRQLVFDGLNNLCKDAFENPPERNGVDLFASFLRHKDLHPKIQTSFINTDSISDNLQYDFFDADDSTGTIILQPKIPIFPEDFPAGVQEWPLSWWGIVEPSIEEKNREEKKEQKTNTDAESHSKSRQDRSGVRSDKGKEGSGDRYKRGNSRSSHKRPSRDRYEDEHLHYDDYPHIEDRRDRFHDGIGSGYPPQHRGGDYEYDHDLNRRSPNRYPDYRNSHHRGGGQPFPHRMRDGPQSRPYPRGAPPPGDYRDGPGDYRDGVRPYPMHGGSGTPPWDYPHRDPHGPQGRGPPPQRDDRREYRERPHRSDRDDGRHSVRKPLSSSSSRKDRTRPSR
mmetsp:Transcript_7958/g.19570  ORF Transcript_7958/g.19570 Transcript_7958/m.19570 type:complete len:548 (-) Transcript_7958:236-1879(-)